MGIKDKLFNWFKAKDKDGTEMNLGYVIDGEPKSIQDLQKLFKAYGLEHKFDLFKPLVRSRIDFELTSVDDELIQIGQSKVGGKPDLDSSTSWPQTNLKKSLSFIAQINCNELMEHNNDSLLPSNGLISFFYDSEQESWGFDPKEKDRMKVIYSTETENLGRQDYPDDLEEHSIFNSNKLQFDNSLSLPGWEHESIEGILNNEEGDNYIEISSGVENQLLGYSNCVQGPMELDCQLVTNGLYCGDSSGYNDPRRKELEIGSKDWILLFQVDSDEDTGMMWGDSGKLYYWIKKQDLIELNFNNCWFSLQCY